MVVALPNKLLGLLGPIQILEYQMVQALCRFDINLVQAMAPIWRQ